MHKTESSEKSESLIWPRTIPRLLRSGCLADRPLKLRVEQCNFFVSAPDQAIWNPTARVPEFLHLGRGTGEIVDVEKLRDSSQRCASRVERETDQGVVLILGQLRGRSERRILQIKV